MITTVSLMHLQQHFKIIIISLLGQALTMALVDPEEKDSTEQTNQQIRLSEIETT